MKHHLSMACLIGAITILGSACAPQDLTPYNPDNNANNVNNTNNINMETDFEKVTKVLAKNCGTQGCHDQNSAFPPKIGGGLDATPEQMKVALDGISSNGGKPLIVAEDAEQSLLYLRISNKQPPVMPPTGAMPDEDVNLVKDWINAGAKYDVSSNPPVDMGNNDMSGDMSNDMGSNDMGADMPPSDMAQSATFDDIVPLIRQCGSCHNGGFAHLPKIEGGVNATRAQVKTALEDVMSAQDPTFSLVDMIYFRIEGETKGSRMPKDASPWPQGDIDKYKAWLDAGANYQ